MTEYYLGVKQVAERLGITSGGLLNLKLPEPDVMIGRTREWKPETIDAWNAARPGRSVGGGDVPASMPTELYRCCRGNAAGSVWRRLSMIGRTVYSCERGSRPRTAHRRRMLLLIPRSAR